jgi:magnesium chelatase family protein
VLDEYLEFDARVKESLREPIERHEITVSRAGGRITFPADFLLVATTNLCPCGDFVPGFVPTCDFSATHCKSYYRRMSGPMLDRFEVIAFSNDWRVGRKKNKKEMTGVDWESLQARVQAAQNFALESRGQTRVNGRLSALEIEKYIPPFVRQHLMPELPSSHRRRLAFLRVARTFADLDASTEIQGIHLERAKTLTLTPFQTMKEAWM